MSCIEGFDFMWKLLFMKIAKSHSPSVRKKQLYLGNSEDKPEKDFAYSEATCSIRGRLTSFCSGHPEISCGHQTVHRKPILHSLKTVVFVQSERSVSTSPARAPLLLCGSFLSLAISNCTD